MVAGTIPSFTSENEKRADVSARTRSEAATKLIYKFSHGMFDFCSLIVVEVVE